VVFLLGTISSETGFHPRVKPEGMLFGIVPWLTVRSTEEA
jgi:hypothetical protein